MLWEFLTWRWRHYDALKCPELLIQWQCNIPEGLNFQINYKSNHIFCILKKKIMAVWKYIMVFVCNSSDLLEMYELWNLLSQCEMDCSRRKKTEHCNMCNWITVWHTRNNENCFHNVLVNVSHSVTVFHHFIQYQFLWEI